MKGETILRQVRKSSLAAALLAALFLPAAADAADMNGSLAIIGRDPRTQEIGIAVLSRTPACGSTVPWVQAGVGAIATMGETNVSWGPRGLAMLRDGVAVQKMVDSLAQGDPEFVRRQIGALDKTGWPAGYTGSQLINWSGGMLDTNLAVQGNTLATGFAVQAMYDTFFATRDRPLADRLFAALHAANARGGDWRGPRSGALLIGRPSQDRPEYASRYVYLRVDDAVDPLSDLERLARDWNTGRMVEAHLYYADVARRAGDAKSSDLERAAAREIVLAALADTTSHAWNLNSMSWQLAQRGMWLEDAWKAITRARAAEPKSTEYIDTAAEIRFRQGKLAEALALAKEASARVPLDDYLKDRVAYFSSQQAPSTPSRK